MKRIDCHQKQMQERDFLTMVESNWNIVQWVCRSFCGCNRQDKEDLSQDIVTNLWRGYADYTPDCTRSTWIYRVAMNTAISWYRHRKRSVMLYPLPQEEIVAEDMENLSSDLIAQFSNQLKKQDQLQLRLYLKGMTQNEIAKILGVDSSYVRGRMTRIREKLRKFAQQEGFIK